jgi:Domain of unknown function (DUF1338)
MILHTIRHQITNRLWEIYRNEAFDVLSLQTKLSDLVLDHYALIDLPGPHCGIPTLTRLFHLIGYHHAGQGYLAEKQNDFVWLSCQHFKQEAKTALPQVVVADFRLSCLPKEIQTIVQHYASYANPPPWSRWIDWIQHCQSGEKTNQTILVDEIVHYLSHRPWPLPTVREFKTVEEFNPLLAWVLVHGHRVNHFGLAIYLMSRFHSFADFNRWIATHLPLSLRGSIVKGSPQLGIEQTASVAQCVSMKLADGSVQISKPFIEFVWRYLQRSNPIYWEDYFQGFISENADRVIETLYLD